MTGWRESTTWMGGSTKRVVSFFSTLISCGLCLSVGICTQAKANRTRLPTITQKAKQKKNQSVIFSLVVFSFIAMTQLELFFYFLFSKFLYRLFQFFANKKVAFVATFKLKTSKEAGIEPTPLVPKTRILPLNYSLFFFYLFI